LGCPSCYHSFRKHLDGLLDRIHGDAHHVGRRPGQHDPNLLITLQRHQLLGELRRAVTSELYEKAAQLRDQLRALEQQQQRSNDAI
jgi:protein arginine kinase activator